MHTQLTRHGSWRSLRRLPRLNFWSGSAIRDVFLFGSWVILLVGLKKLLFFWRLFHWGVVRHVMQPAVPAQWGRKKMTRCSLHFCMIFYGFQIITLWWYNTISTFSWLIKQSVKKGKRMKMNDFKYNSCFIYIESPTSLCFLCLPVYCHLHHKNGV